MPGFPPKKLLVLMDGSPSSMTAWRQARLLASRFGATADVLHVQPWVRDGVGLGMGYPRATAQRSSSTLAFLRRRLGKGVRINSIIGEPDVVAARWAKSKKYDLLVVGTSGRGGLARVLIGSVAESVVRNATVPVFVARRALTSHRRVLAPVNLMPHSYAGLAEAAHAALALDARLTILFVAEPVGLRRRAEVRKLEEVLEKLVRGLPERVKVVCRPRYRIVTGDAARRIVAESAGHDLVVLTARLSRLIGDFVLGTTAERVLRHASCSVLTSPSRR